MMEIKAISYMFVFLFEDCGELFLEYIYIEKYFTVQPPWYMIGKDIVIVFIVLLTIANDKYNMKEVHCMP